MARQAVVEIQCDRCTRKEYRDDNEKPEEGVPELYIKFRGREIRYEDLCSPCRKTVAGYVESITKDLKNKSPARTAKKKGGSAETPPPVAHGRRAVS